MRSTIVKVVVLLAAIVLVLAVGLAPSACGTQVTTTTAPAATTATAAASTTTSLSAPTVAGTIAFGNHVGKGNDDICIVNTDGTGFATIAGGENIQMCPRWSPDGSKILYTELGPESDFPSMDLWIVNADGSGRKLLRDGPVRDAFATWSPDGTQIAWTGWVRLHNLGTGQPERGAIWVMNADGTGAHRITTDEGPGIDFMPTWAADGKIYFTRVVEGEGPSVAFRVNPDGSGLEELRTIGSDIRLSLVSFVPSPDGTRAAFQDDVNLPASLVVTASNGADDRVALLDPVSLCLGRAAANTSWSPDGKALVFAGNSWGPTPYTCLYIVNADGTGLSVVPGIEKAMDPAWRPQ
jgi:Tol biopolymer transport system component